MPVVFLACGAFVGGARWQSTRLRGGVIRADTIVYRDTLRLRDTLLVPHRVWITRYDTARVAVAPDSSRTSLMASSSAALCADSLTAVLPVEMREYESDDYRVVIAGFRPELLALDLYPPSRSVTRTVARSGVRSRIGVGVYVGYGLSTGVVDNKRVVCAGPSVGVGVCYRLF